MKTVQEVNTIISPIFFILYINYDLFLDICKV